jgi:hypothetical protein
VRQPLPWQRPLRYGEVGRPLRCQRPLRYNEVFHPLQNNTRCSTARGATPYIAEPPSTPLVCKLAFLRVGKVLTVRYVDTCVRYEWDLTLVLVKGGRGRDKAVHICDNVSRYVMWGCGCLLSTCLHLWRCLRNWGVGFIVAIRGYIPLPQPIRCWFCCWHSCWHSCFGCCHSCTLQCSETDWRNRGGADAMEGVRGPCCAGRTFRNQRHAVGRTPYL